MWLWIIHRWDARPRSLCVTCMHFGSWHPCGKALTTRSRVAAACMGQAGGTGRQRSLAMCLGIDLSRVANRSVSWRHKEEKWPRVAQRAGERWRQWKIQAGWRERVRRGRREGDQDGATPLPSHCCQIRENPSLYSRHSEINSMGSNIEKKIKPNKKYS